MEPDEVVVVAIAPEEIRKTIYSIPEGVFEQYERIIKLACRFGASPWKWCKEDCALKLEKNKFRSFLLYLHVASLFILATYFTVQLYRFSRNGEISLSYIISLMLSVLCWLGFYIYILWIKCSADMVVITTDCLKILYDFEEKFIPSKQKAQNDTLVRILQGTYTAPYVVGFTVTAFYILFYTEPVFLYVDLPREYQHFLFVVFVAMLFFWETAAAVSIEFVGIEGQLLVFYAADSLAKELTQGRKMYRSLTILRNSPEVIIKYVNIMKYYLQYFQMSFGLILAPNQALLTRLIMLLSVFIMKYYKTIHPFVLFQLIYFVFFVFLMWSMTLLLINKCTETYNDMIQSVELYTSHNQADVEYIKKFKLSCKSTHFIIGLDEPVTNKSVPRFVLSLSGGVMKLLTLSKGPIGVMDL